MNSLSQESTLFINKIIDEKINDLKLNGINDFFIIKPGGYTGYYDNTYIETCFEGKLESPPSKTTERDGNIYFMFWFSNEFLNLKRYDFCGVYETIVIEESKLKDLFLESKDDFKKYDLKPYEVVNENGSKDEFIINHSGSYIFFFSIDDDKFSKEIENYRLSERSVNYNYNKSLALVKLYDLSFIVIEQLEKEDRFMLTKRD